MNYTEMTVDEAIEFLKLSKGKKVLVAIKNLEDDEDVIFYPKSKVDCEEMIRDAQTIVTMCDDFVKKLDLFTEQQKDLHDIQLKGFRQTILIR